MKVAPSSRNVRFIQWPCLLLCNELLISLNQATELEGSDKELWLKICKNEYCYCAVIEAYDIVKYLFQKIIKEDSEEHSILVNLFKEIDESLRMGNFKVKYKMSELPEIHSKLITLVNGLLTKQPDKGQQIVVDALQNLYDIVVRDFPKENVDYCTIKERWTSFYKNW